MRLVRQIRDIEATAILRLELTPRTDRRPIIGRAKVCEEAYGVSG
ncbi:MAG: hypothetical protein ACE5JM_12330 [Armatimonadota bacterium]